MEETQKKNHEPEYNSFVFSIEHYNTVDDMWKDIISFIRIAQKQDLICVIRTEITDEVIVVEYEHDESIESWGVSNPYWITQDEYCEIINQRALTQEVSHETINENIKIKEGK